MNANGMHEVGVRVELDNELRRTAAAAQARVEAVKDAALRRGLWRRPARLRARSWRAPGGRRRNLLVGFVGALDGVRGRFDGIVEIVLVLVETRALGSQFFQIRQEIRRVGLGNP